MSENIQFDINDALSSQCWFPQENQTPAPPVPPESDLQYSFTEESLEDKIKRYLETNKVKVCILTPFYGGMCHVNYVNCLLETKNMLEHFKIPLKIEFCKNDSLVTRARNNLIAKAMSDPEVTNIIFIDSDISWSPTDILKLILSDKELVGGTYPWKKYFFDRLGQDNYVNFLLNKKRNSQLNDKISDEDYIQSNLLKYNINYIDNNLAIQNNLCRIKHLATGFMMMKRSVIDKMIVSMPTLKYTDDVGFLNGDENKFAYAFFDCAIEDEHYLSEDWLFCSRWKKIGGDVWLDISISLTHSGPEDFKGCYMASIV